MTPHDVVIWLLRLSGYGIALLALWPLGNEFTRMMLDVSGTMPSPAKTRRSPRRGGSASIKAGRYIGAIERLLIMVGIFVRSWEVIAAVVALKSVARYKELDRQISAEYFLIGSLASIAWGTGVSIVLVWYDNAYGFGIAEWAAAKLAGT